MPATTSADPALDPGAPTTAMIGRMRGSVRAHHWRKFKSALTSWICFLCNLVVITPLALVFGYLVVKGAGSINVAFFTQLPVPVGETGGGIANAIAGTLILVAIAAAVGVPVGVLGAIYLAEFSGPRFAGWVRFAADILKRRAFDCVGHRCVRAAGAAAWIAHLAGALFGVRGGSGPRADHDSAGAADH